MKTPNNHDDLILDEGEIDPRIELNSFFMDCLKRMYFAESSIGTGFQDIQTKIATPELKKILEIHYALQQKHKERLEKIFKLRNEPIKGESCIVLDALITDSQRQLAVFSNDITNWEIALIHVSQKFAHYKTASYGGLAHLAINLNYCTAATLLAVSAQEEEEFTANHLNGMFDAFLSTHVEEYKPQTI